MTGPPEPRAPGGAAGVNTTAGPVPAERLGRTLIHEHLRSFSEPVRHQFPHLYDHGHELERAIEEVRRAQSHGVETIVDPACMDLGRDAGFTLEVVAATGIRVVMATGIYGQHYTFLPHHFQNQTVDYLADAFVHDVEVGIQGTAVRAGLIKVAVDAPGMTEDMEKVHRAAARASRRTGVPIMAHSRPADRTGIVQLDLLAEEGVDPSRVLVAHSGDTDDFEYLERLLERGAWLGMDRYGTVVYLPDGRRNEVVAELCRRGHADRLMLSHDACATVDWFPPERIARARKRWNFGYLFEGVLPRLAELGVTEEQAATMLEGNPGRWLAPRPPEPDARG